MVSCIICSYTVIHQDVTLNIGSLIDRDIVIEEFIHLNAGKKVVSNNVVPLYSFLEVGTTIRHKS